MEETKIKKLSPYRTPLYIIYIVFIVLCMPAYIAATTELFANNNLTLLSWITGGCVFLTALCINVLHITCNNQSRLYSIQMVFAIIRLVLFCFMLIGCIGGCILAALTYFDSTVWDTAYTIAETLRVWSFINSFFGSLWGTDECSMVMLAFFISCMAVIILCIANELKLWKNYTILKKYFENRPHSVRIRTYPAVFRFVMCAVFIFAVVLSSLSVSLYVCIFFLMEAITFLLAGLSVMREREVIIITRRDKAAPEAVETAAAVSEEAIAEDAPRKPEPAPDAMPAANNGSIDTDETPCLPDEEQPSGDAEEDMELQACADADECSENSKDEITDESTAPQVQDTNSASEKPEDTTSIKVFTDEETGELYCILDGKRIAVELIRPTDENDEDAPAESEEPEQTSPENECAEDAPGNEQEMVGEDGAKTTDTNTNE